MATARITLVSFEKFLFITFSFLLIIMGILHHYDKYIIYYTFRFVNYKKTIIYTVDNKKIWCYN